jgi:Protein of unknown function (DUF2505)
VGFTVDEKVAVSADVAVRAYGDPAFYEGRLPRDNISVVEVVSHEATDHHALIEVRFQFTGSVSSAVRAIIDPSKMSWVTRTEITPDEYRSSFTVLPDHYPDRLTSHGTFTFVDDGSGSGCTVRVEGELKVHVPIVGRTVERVIVSGLRSYLAAEVAGLPAFAAGG